MSKDKNIRDTESLKTLLEKYSVIGVIDLFKLPTKQMQEIKKKLGSKVMIRIFKKSILSHAMEKIAKLKVLHDNLPAQPAMILTEEDPFRLYLTISKLKSDTFAKDGDVAIDEIEVYAGPTSLLPGPVISEFAKVKIPAGVEAGKIAIKKDTVVARKGDVISKDLAGIIRKLNIKPMKIGLNVVCIFDGINLFKKDVLELVGDVYLNKLKEAFSSALNLSIGVGYPTKDNVGYILSKAYNQAKFFESKLVGGAQ